MKIAIVRFIAFVTSGYMYLARRSWVALSSTVFILRNIRTHISTLNSNNILFNFETIVNNNLSFETTCESQISIQMTPESKLEAVLIIWGLDILLKIYMLSSTFLTKKRVTGVLIVSA